VRSPCPRLYIAVAVVINITAPRPLKPGPGLHSSNQSRELWQWPRHNDSTINIVTDIIIRPHPSATYVDAVYCYRLSIEVCLSVCLSVTIVSPAKTAEPIEMLCGLWTMGRPKEACILDGSAHWRNLANTNKPPICGGDAAFL